MLMKKIHVFFTSMVLLLFSFTAAAQLVMVKGTVKDAAGEGIPAASVVLQGSTKSYAMTDTNGGFSIRVPSDGILVVSCVGFRTQEVPVNGRSSIDIVMEDDTQMLDETIIVAFGTTTKEAFTGSATVVKTETLERSQVSAVTSALAGQVAGVQLTTSSGAPGSSPSIRIRGFSSISAGKEPLYVVDGMPFDGDINNINPNDVESMTVLKDAAANALYGARGANGVIIINNSRGPLVVPEDLAEALNSGKVFGAGLDVMLTEPPAVWPIKCTIFLRDSPLSVSTARSIRTLPWVIP